MSTTFPPQVAGSGGVELFDPGPLFTPNAADGFIQDDPGDGYTQSYIDASSAVWLYFDVYHPTSRALTAGELIILGTLDASLFAAGANRTICGCHFGNGDTVLGAVQVDSSGNILFTPFESHAAGTFMDFELYGLRYLLASAIA